jgi:hypothetical protein
MLYVELNVRGGRKGTYGPALRQRDVRYRGAMLMQLDAFIMFSVSHVKETVSGPPKKVWSDLRVVCIVVDVLEGRDAARRCASLQRYMSRDVLLTRRGWGCARGLRYGGQ